MFSIIIISKQNAKRKKYIQDFSLSRNIDQVDITLFEKGSDEKTQSIGIDAIKQMQQKIYYKPIKSQEKAIIIEDAQLLTIEAQNALLKVLEEPPDNTLIILGSESKEVLIPTIRSRCQIIELEQETVEITEKDREEINSFLQNLPVMAIGELLKKAEILAKDKEKAITWIEKVIILLHKQLLDETNQIFAIQRIRSFQQLHTLLKTTNVNPRMAIENTFLMQIS